MVGNYMRLVVGAHESTIIFCCEFQTEIPRMTNSNRASLITVPVGERNRTEIPPTHTPTKTWEITIVVSDRFYAGSDSYVFMNIRRHDRQTQDIQYKPPGG